MKIKSQLVALRNNSIKLNSVRFIKSDFQVVKISYLIDRKFWYQTKIYLIKLDVFQVKLAV